MDETQDELLRQLKEQQGGSTLEDQSAVPGYLQPRAVTPLGPKRLRYSHDAMIDLLVAKPDISQNELAGVFGYTPSWVSVIMASDAFRERLAMRRHEMIDPELRTAVQERFRAIVLRSQEVLLEKLAQPHATIADATVLKALEMGGKAINAGGLGHAPPPAPMVVEPSENLNRLANRLTGLLRQARKENDDVEDATCKGLTIDSPRESVSGPTLAFDDAGEGAGGPQAD